MKIQIVENMDEVIEIVLTKKLDWGIEHRREIGGIFNSQRGKSAN